MSTPTTTTTTPTPEPVAVRGDRVVVTADDLPEGHCFVPDDRITEFIGLNYVDCDLLEPEVQIAPPVPQAASLPATGTGLDAALIAMACVVAGLTARIAARRPA